MMIHKYELELYQPTILELPIDSSLLDIQMQNNNLVVWIVYGKSNTRKTITIHPIFTGQQTHDYVYLATVQSISGLVVHYFKSEE